MSYTTPPTVSQPIGSARKEDFEVKLSKGLRYRHIRPEGCRSYKVAFNTSPRRKPGEYLFPI
ncbi:MAG TPA: hypothetical protein VF101_19220 [Gaiellaceae bacterium]